MKNFFTILFLGLTSMVSAQSSFNTKSDVLLYLSSQSPFRSDKGVSLSFPEKGARMAINASIKFFNPEVTLVSKVKATVRYQSLTNASGMFVIAVDAGQHTVTDQSDNLIYNSVVTESVPQEGEVSEEGKLNANDQNVYAEVEESASPIGGMAAFYMFIGSKLKYPSAATRMGVEGKVFVEFIINKDGTLSDTKVVRGIGAGCDEEAMRVIMASPPWNPGKQKGKPVRQKYTLPIQFKLQ